MATQVQVSTQSRRRHSLIAAIEAERRSKVITYFVGDRPNVMAMVGEDAVRPMYDHLKSIRNTKRIDLFLYTRGGAMEVPWRIVTMIREFTEEFAVLVPYKCWSAGTIIALGAEEIVVGRKGELGPIDPQVPIQIGEGGLAQLHQLSVEDLMSYLDFLREKAGLSDHTALAGAVSLLINKVGPPLVGQLNRVHSHIRDVARKMLTARNKKAQLSEQQIKSIIESLAEKTYQHGHAIGRAEAEDIGLKIVRPSRKLETRMWNLYEAYEDLSKLLSPIDQRTFIPSGHDAHTERVVIGCIESVRMAHHFAGDYCGRNKRQVPPQTSLNLNLTVQWPPSVQPQQLPAGAQQAIQEILQQAQPLIQQQAESAMQQQVLQLMPVTGFDGWLQDGAWRRVTDWPATSQPRKSRKRRSRPGRTSRGVS